MNEMPRRVALPRVDQDAAQPDASGESAPPEALRAIAALLGRAAAPGGSTPKRASSNRSSDSRQAPRRRATPPRPRAGQPRPNFQGDREVPIQGGAPAVGEDARDEVRRARKRMRRARRAVREALERLVSAPPEDLAG